MASIRLQHAERLAKLLDNSLVIPGTNLRIGLDPIIGLIPGLGDWITSLFSFVIVLSAYRDGVSRWTIARMTGNILFDFVLGSIPFLGDAADIFWRSNTRNIALWQRADKRPESGWRDFAFVAAISLAALSLMVVLTFLIWNAIDSLIGAMLSGMP